MVSEIGGSAALASAGAVAQALEQSNRKCVAEILSWSAMWDVKNANVFSATDNKVRRTQF